MVHMVVGALSDLQHCSGGLLCVFRQWGWGENVEDEAGRNSRVTREILLGVDL